MTMATRKWLVSWAVVAMCLGGRGQPHCPADKCPEGWVTFRDHSCVKLFLELRKTWPEAESICRQLGPGSYLVKLLDAADNAELAELIRPHIPLHQITWIGLNDIAEEGEWRWAGEPQVGAENYVNFGPNEPNNWNSEDCAGYRPDPYKWNDLQCSAQTGFICQKPLCNAACGLH